MSQVIQVKKISSFITGSRSLVFIECEGWLLSALVTLIRRYKFQTLIIFFSVPFDELTYKLISSLEVSQPKTCVPFLLCVPYVPFVLPPLLLLVS